MVMLMVVVVVDEFEGFESPMIDGQVVEGHQ